MKKVKIGALLFGFCCGIGVGFFAAAWRTRVATERAAAVAKAAAKVIHASFEGDNRWIASVCRIENCACHTPPPTVH
jgi:hypothetical protein